MITKSQVNFAVINHRPIKARSLLSTACFFLYSYTVTNSVWTPASLVQMMIKWYFWWAIQIIHDVIYITTISHVDLTTEDFDRNKISSFIACGKHYFPFWINFSMWSPFFSSMKYTEKCFASSVTQYNRL